MLAKDKHRIERETKRLIKKWTPRLQLGAWQIRVLWNHREDKDTMASSGWSDGYRNVYIRLNDNAYPIHYDMEGTEFEHVVVHELMHLRLATLEDWISNNLREAGPIGSAIMMITETLTDELAALFIKAYAKEDVARARR